MALIDANGASAATAAVNAQITKIQNNQPIKNTTDIAKDIAAAYHDYAKTAILPGADMTAGGTLSILEAAFVSDNTNAMVAKIAQGICDYWSSFITTGIPAHGGTSVISVVVNGSATLAAMTSAVQALITDTSVSNAWLSFYADTENIVKTIPCIITELIPGTPPVPTPFPATIS